MRFLDTNVLLYSVSDDPAESSKRAIAIDLLDGDENAVSVQVLQEFYVQATRATRRNPLSSDLAIGLIQTWLRFQVQEITVTVMSRAFEIKSGFGLSYWDAAIVAAAQVLGCHEVMSEDMSHGRKIHGVTIRNPFR